MFETYDLNDDILYTLREKGFTTPTPIQEATLPHGLAGGDVLGQARTGTGKTLAFALPIASRLGPDPTRGRAPRALILTPTRELAIQVASELDWVAPHLVVLTVYGGTGYGQQARDLKRGVDVVVATPGRARDYQDRGILGLGSVQIVVLDEADEMLSMGFEEEVEAMLAAIPQERQTMLFSATLPPWAKRMSEQYLRDPVRVNLATTEAVTYQEIAIEAPLQTRINILGDVLHAHGDALTIVFTHTKVEVDELARALAEIGHPAEAIHGDLSQSQRERVVHSFREGRVTVLVGTDVAARGLDIPEVDLVVHYRVPREGDAYQHRSGRTGRAGRTGTVILLYAGSERRKLASLERAVGRRFERAAPPRPGEVQDAKLQGLLTRVERQSDEDKDVWRAVAETWIETGNEDAVAGLLAMVLGGAPDSRSLLTGEEGWATVKLSDGIANPSHVVRVLKSAGTGQVGRIRVVSDGALADLRPEDADRLLGSEVEGVAIRRAERAQEEVGRDQGRSGGSGKRGRRFGAKKRR